MRRRHKKRRAVNARLFYRKTATSVAEVQGILPPKNFIGLEWTAIARLKAKQCVEGTKKARCKCAPVLSQDRDVSRGGAGDSPQKKLYRFGVDSNCAAKSQAMRRRHKKGAL